MSAAWLYLLEVKGKSLLIYKWNINTSRTWLGLSLLFIVNWERERWRRNYQTKKEPGLEDLENSQPINIAKNGKVFWRECKRCGWTITAWRVWSTNLFSHLSRSQEYTKMGLCQQGYCPFRLNITTKKDRATVRPGCQRSGILQGGTTELWPWTALFIKIRVNMPESDLEIDKAATPTTTRLCLLPDFKEQGCFSLGFSVRAVVPVGLGGRATTLVGSHQADYPWALKSNRTCPASFGLTWIHNPFLLPIISLLEWKCLCLPHYYISKQVTCLKSQPEKNFCFRMKHTSSLPDTFRWLFSWQLELKVLGCWDIDECNLYMKKIRIWGVRG